MATHRPTQPSLAQAHVPGHPPHQTLNHVQNRTPVRPVAAHPLPQLRKPYPPPQEPDSPHPLTEPSPFFMKPLTRAPDYRFNLYVKGLAPTTTTRGLFELFKPYGNILACKTILDTETGHCRGGFVLFDNQESCSEARRALTQQGLYVAVAHESACIKNLPPPESPPPEIKAEVPELGDSDQFPSLPSKPPKKQQKKAKVSSKASSKASLEISSKTSSEASSGLASGSSSESPLTSAGSSIHAEVPSHPPPSTSTPPSFKHDYPAAGDPTPAIDHFTHHEPREHCVASSNSSRDLGSIFPLGHSYLDFDSGFIGTHQQFLSDGFHNPSGFERGPSFLGNKPYMGVEDIDRYMNMLEMNAASVQHQLAANMPEGRQAIHASGAHLSNTTLDDFMLEERPRRESTLHFDNLPDGLRYQELFELCAQYGSLVLTSVDIRYINEDCLGQGRVTFESHKDSETALVSLLAKHFTVRLGDTGDMYQSEPTIDDHLYDQYFQQHQDFLRFGDAGPYGSPDETLGGTYNQGFFSTTPGAQSFPPLNSDFEPETMWNTPFLDKMSQVDSGMLHGHVPLLDRDMENLAYRHEKLSMLGISPQPISFSPASSSSSSSLQQFHELAESSPLAAKSISTESELVTRTSTTMSDPSVSESDESAAAHVASQQDASKFLSYSDIVKAPVKPPTTLHGKENLPHQDMKRRGNTNKSLDEKEYRLNLFLKNLEPSMDEYKLYDICVQFGPVMSCRTITMNHGVCTGLGFVMYINNECVDRAIEGLGKLGIHAEVAVQSATNKLRCKTLSDMLFIQNIPPHIKENKLRDLFRPYTLLSCNILKDPKTGKSRGVGFLKVKDTKVAERFIEQYHGRVLGKDWKLPLQVSPAKQ